MSEVGNPRVGQWYTRQDTGQLFWVTHYDDHSGTVEIQMSDGDLDELEEETWQSLPLDLSEPAPDWTDPLANEDATEDERADSAEGSGESWEDSSPFDEFDRYSDRLASGDFD
jgi:hypothetical protein